MPCYSGCFGLEKSAGRILLQKTISTVSAEARAITAHVRSLRAVKLYAQYKPGAGADNQGCAVMKLNLGCGSQVPEGWVNVDYALGARFAKNPLFRLINKPLGLFDMQWNDKIFLHDLTKPFPWADSSVEAVYTSHTLEHLSREEGRSFLSECHRVLKRDGIIRVIVPDLKHVVDEYTQGHIKADNVLEELGVLFGVGSSPLKKRLAPFVQFPHKCMYDTPRLLEILDEMGFMASSKGAFDSGIPDIRSIEFESRTEHAVVVEGRKR
jgi:predicted SAM-dependent methyltransferase